MNNRKPTRKNEKKITVNLALQGGGSHGAFTWGVLDRLMEIPNLDIEGISGTSAGALNAAIFTAGLIKSGPEGAKKDLARFWKTISFEGSTFNPLHAWINIFEKLHLEWHPMAMWIDMISQIFSPSQLNPYDYNPLRDIIREQIDFETLRKSKKHKLFVNATNVETNKVKIFQNEELCEEAFLASTCLPNLFRPVEWKGQYYWDGGYTGNPILEPLIYNCEAKDIIIVPINAINRRKVPDTSIEIINRLNEITFNSSLIREIRNIRSMEEFSQATATLNPFIGVRLHHIHDDDFMAQIGARNKFNTDYSFLQDLFHKGRETADKWTQEHFHLVGKETTMDFSEWQLETPHTTCLSWEQPSKAKPKG